MYSQRLPHSILLSGKQGCGLDTAAQWLVDKSGSTSLIILPEYDERVDTEKGRITIGVIRRLYEQTRVKNVRHRCVIISQADTMTTEAQHAFLKLLEEPSDAVSFILLCHAPDQLLRTVTSRVQQIRVRPIDRHQSESLLTSLGSDDPTTRTQLLFIAEGLPGRLTKLVGSKELFEVEVARLRMARTVIQGDTYQRLVACHQVKDSREDARALVSYMIRLLRHDITKKQTAGVDTLSLLDRLEVAASRLDANANIRIALAAAMV